MEAYLQAIASGDDDAAERLVQQLTAGDEDALIALAASENADERWWAVRGLAEIGALPSLPILEARLSDSDQAIRAAAAMAIGRLAVRVPLDIGAALDAVAALLSGPDGMVRQAAADTLAQCGDAAVPALVTVLQTSNHEGARTRAAGALRKIGTMRAAGALYPLLNDPNHLVRSYAYEGLDEMGLLENVLLIV